MTTLNSMTGYAVETVDLPVGALSLELRGVNSRFLDLNFRMGEDFRALEPQLRERISERVKRGKLECRVNFAARQASSLPNELNDEMLQQLASLADAAREALPDARPLTLGEILRWPGMLGESTLDLESLHKATLLLLDAAIKDFNTSRAREGDKLKAIIRERVNAMRGLAATLRPKIPAIVAAYKEKLQKRLEEMLQHPDQDRLHQEVALFAQKIDVDEELDRLLTHLTEVERVLDAGGAAGKRLDFLMQELNREANTLGSKSVSMELSRASVEFKVLIEQMREQIQNIE